MNAMNESVRATVAAAELAEVKRRVRRNILVGILGDAGDQDALLALLDAVRTAGELDAFRRMVCRWEHATAPKSEWVTWDEFEAMSRN